MQRQTHLYFYWILFLSHFQKKSSCLKKILIGTINFIYALMYPKVCILHYFYFLYRCWYAIHYQTQMDFQNPISLLQFSISLLTFYAWLTSEHLGPLAHLDFNLSRERAPLSGCVEVVLGPWPVAALPCPLSVMWVSPRPGLVPWRLCPILGVGVGLGGFRLPQKWLSWSWQQLNGAAYSLKLNEVSNQTSVSGDLSHHKSSVSRHAHLQRWPGAFSARCYGSTELHQGRWT